MPGNAGHPGLRLVPLWPWIAYTKMGVEMHDSIYLYSMDQKKSHRITDGRTQDWSPSFDRDGKYLWFLSNRTVEPHMGFDEMNYACFDMAKPYFFILAADAASPYAPKDSEEEVKEEKKPEVARPPKTRRRRREKALRGCGAAEKRGEPAKPLDKKGEELKPAQPPTPPEKKNAKPAKDEPADAKKADKADDKKADDKKDEKKTKIDLDGSRVASSSPKASRPATTSAAKRSRTAAFTCPRASRSSRSTRSSLTTPARPDAAQVHARGQEHRKLMSGIANYHQSADGKKLIYRAGSSYGVVDAGQARQCRRRQAGARQGPAGARPPAEFRQIFNEAWRIERDWFYDSKMHGVDWAAMREQYGRSSRSAATAATSTT